MMIPRDFESTRAQQNIANAAFSTGPTSAAGKLAVSYNSTKHNLTSTGKDRVALPGEQPAFEQFCCELRAELAPVGPTEECLVGDIGGGRWRLIRARAMENALFAKIERENAAAPSDRTASISKAEAQAEAWIDAAKGLQRLSLYAARIERGIAKAAAALELKQSARRAAESKARDEAILLTQLAESEGKTYQPGNDFTPASAHGGFVFSPSEIAAVLDRNRHLEAAQSRFTTTGATLQACA